MDISTYQHLEQDILTSHINPAYIVDHRDSFSLILHISYLTLLLIPAADIAFCIWWLTFDKMEGEDNLLYGDLENTARDAEMQGLVDGLQAEQKKNSQLMQDMQLMKDQVACLIAEKSVLETNIVAVYNTAMREIKRKDGEIVTLKAALAAASSK